MLAKAHKALADAKAAVAEGRAGGEKRLSAAKADVELLQTNSAEGNEARLIKAWYLHLIARCKARIATTRRAGLQTESSVAAANDDTVAKEVANVEKQLAVAQATKRHAENEFMGACGSAVP